MRLGLWCSLIGKRAKRVVIVSQRTRHIARLAQMRRYFMKKISVYLVTLASIDWEFPG